MGSREEQLAQLLADPTRRAVLQRLEETGEELELRELSELVFLRESGRILTDEFEGELERISIGLHHEHLPRLADAGLIEYDPGENVARISEHGADVEPAELTALDELLERLCPSGPDEGTIGTLTGCDEIAAYARKIADRASDELLLVYHTDEFLSEECLPAAREATERGVELYAGATSPSARSFFQEHLPEATVWEPQQDWRYQRSGYPSLGRLVLADRERVIVSLCRGPGSEVALVGEGEESLFVVLVRELLGSRIDHLDYQSENLLGTLPYRRDEQ